MITLVLNFAGDTMELRPVEVHPSGNSPTERANALAFADRFNHACRHPEIAAAITAAVKTALLLPVEPDGS
jgi:hypothetical protein